VVGETVTAADVEPQAAIPTTSPMDPRFWAWLADTVQRSQTQDTQGG
jgi:hypothetical protein